MKVKLALIAITLIFALTSCTQSPESSIKRRIQHVEHGILRTYGDPPWKRMELVDCMVYYNVSGISITVINDFKVEWARGYGVLDAGNSVSVTPETLFQTGSIAKLVVAVAALYDVESDALDLDSDVNQSLVSWQVPVNELTAEETENL